MREGEFYGRASGDGRRSARIVGLAVVVVVGLVGVAIAKPWSGGGPAAPTPGPLGELTATQAPSGAPIGTELPPPPILFPATPRPVAFVTPAPPPTAAAWTGLRWRLLSPDDPLTLVRSVVRWRGGFVAVGGDTVDQAPTTPLWTSPDGMHWDPLPFGTAPTLWPGILVRGMAEVPSGVVALSERLSPTCGGELCLGPYASPVLAWTSTDGRTWSPHPLPMLDPSSASGVAPLLADGPAGLVAVAGGPRAHVATSRDGVRWTVLPDASLPGGFAVAALAGRPTGYVLAGAVATGPSSTLTAATAWSDDGRAWTALAGLPTTGPAGADPIGGDSTSIVDGVVAGRDGLIAEGRWAATGADLWWQSSDGRHWRALAQHQPVGSTAWPAPNGTVYANGVLVGDRERMLALSYRSDAQAWISSDGRSWTQLGVTGDLPNEQARLAIMFPSGVLFTDGSSTWFGEATVG